jgi:lipopolysaccharide transport system permease protein
VAVTRGRVAAPAIHPPALTRRDFSARYKQALLGIGWAVVIPFLTMVVFSVFVPRFAVVSTRGVPYPVWSVGLLPWTYSARAGADRTR